MRKTINDKTYDKNITYWGAHINDSPLRLCVNLIDFKTEIFLYYSCPDKRLSILVNANPPIFIKIDFKHCDEIVRGIAEAYKIEIPEVHVKS
jgi:hypothetical protein